MTCAIVLRTFSETKFKNSDKLLLWWCEHLLHTLQLEIYWVNKSSILPYLMRFDIMDRILLEAMV